MYIKRSTPPVVIVYNRPIENILKAVERVNDSHGLPTLVTSGNDSLHHPNSKHYTNEALDFRRWYMDKLGIHTVEEIVGNIKALLGKHYDVILEKDHLHVEYDPKGK